MATVSAQPRVGPLLRKWRKRRRRTQLDLALDAGISPRHLSFVETGRSTPSADMVLLLAEQVAVTGDDEMAALLEALPDLARGREPPAPGEAGPASAAAARGILMPLRLRAPEGRELSFFGTVATFGTPVEVTTSELSIECLFPADAATAEAAEPRPAILTWNPPLRSALSSASGGFGLCAPPLGLAQGAHRLASLIA